MGWPITKNRYASIVASTHAIGISRRTSDGSSFTPILLGEPSVRPNEAIRLIMRLTRLWLYNRFIEPARFVIHAVPSGTLYLDRRADVNPITAEAYLDIKAPAAPGQYMLTVEVPNNPFTNDVHAKTMLFEVGNAPRAPGAPPGGLLDLPSPREVFKGFDKALTALTIGGVALGVGLVFTSFGKRQQKS